MKLSSIFVFAPLSILIVGVSQAAEQAVSCPTVQAAKTGAVEEPWIIVQSDNPRWKEITHLTEVVIISNTAPQEDLITCIYQTEPEEAPQLILDRSAHAKTDDLSQEHWEKKDDSDSSESFSCGSGDTAIDPSECLWIEKKTKK